MQLALVARRSTPTNEALARVRHPVGRWEPMSPERALARLRSGDIALGRLDVLPALDGIDDGLWALGALERRGVRVLNRPSALLAAHDKLLTARLLRRHGIPHPRTRHLRPGRPVPIPEGPVVVKPRFGSWGRDVYRCDDGPELHETLELVRSREWYPRHGVLMQELVPPQGYDLRVLVAAGQVLGAIYRFAAVGEWRTNVALGGERRPVEGPLLAASELALAAARAVRGDLVGIDLLPDGRGGWVVAEVNGAVEFTSEYATGRDVFAETAFALAAGPQTQVVSFAV